MRYGLRRGWATGYRRYQIHPECLKQILADPGDIIADADDLRRWGPCVEGAGLHHNPTPGPAGEKYVYGHLWVTLAALHTHPDEGVRALPVRADLSVRAADATPELQQQGWHFQTKLERTAAQLHWLRGRLRPG